MRIAIIALTLTLALPAVQAIEEPPENHKSSEHLLAMAGPLNAAMSVGWSLDGKNVLPFEACARLEFDAAYGDAVAKAIGWMNGSTQLRVTMSDHVGAPNLTFNRSAGAPSWGGFPSVASQGTAVGNTATIEVNAHNFSDPVTGSDYFDARAVVLKGGVRNEQTNAIVKRDGAPYDAATPNDVRVEGRRDEIHVAVRNPIGHPTEDHFTRRNPAATPDGSTGLDQEHNVAYLLVNRRWLGRAEVTIRLETPPAPVADSTNLRFLASDIHDRPVAEAQLAGSGAHEAKLLFPLDSPDNYTLTVTGQAAFAKYTIDVRMIPPPEFLLNLWWTRSYVGPDAMVRAQKCEQELEGRLGDRPSPIPLKVQPGKPPLFGLVAVIVGVAGASVGILFVSKLVFQERGAAAFQKAFRRR